MKNNSDVKIKIGTDHEEIILYPSGKIVPIIFYYNKSNSQIIENNIPIKLNKKIYTYNYLYKSNYFNEPFCLNNKGDAFYVLNEDRQKYVWLNYVTNIDDKIPKIKTNFQISYLYADYKNCFVIDFNGNLYGLGDNTYNQISKEKNNFIKFFTKIPLPDNCKTFIKCVCGIDYILCLIQENEGKYKIYAKGNNEKFQCGIPGIKLVTVLTKCKFNEDIEINDIFSNEYFSSAITTDYKLYIWGTKYINSNKENFVVKKKIIELPTLVKADNILVEHMAINQKNIVTQIFLIGKSLNKNENNIWSKKCYSLDIDEEFILKEIIPWNCNNAIPLKVYSYENGYYILYFDENKYINRILEEYKEKNYLISFYNSKNLNIFIKNINSFTDKEIILFVDIIEQIKEKRNDEDIIENLSFNEFRTYIQDKNIYKQLLNLLENNNDYLFDYLKWKSIIVSKYFFQYYQTNMLSTYKKLLQPIIIKNILFLPSEMKINFFFSRLDYKRYNNMYNIDIDRLKANSFIEKFELMRLPKK